MNILERVLSMVAPHECVGCGKEDTLLCEVCRIDIVGTIPSRCYRCHKLTRQFQVCDTCRRKVVPRHVWIATEYSGLPKELIHRLKFERAKSASGIIATILDNFLPLLPDDTIVTFIPTTPSRIRVRGYDQSRQIAKRFAYLRGLVFEDLISRSATTRQVGSSRKTRFEQMANAFEMKKQKVIQGRTVLLIDDVLTTGATIESASRLLADSGAKRVEVAVFAH